MGCDLRISPRLATGIKAWLAVVSMVSEGSRRTEDLPQVHNGRVGPDVVDGGDLLERLVVVENRLIALGGRAGEDLLVVHFMLLDRG